MSAIATALNGIQTATGNLDRAANNIANLSTPGYENVDLAAQAIALITAQRSVQADTAVIKTQDDLTQSQLDISA